MMLLTENHARVISATLKAIEERIDKIEMYIKGSLKSSSYKIENDLNEEENRAVLKICDLAKKTIEEIYIKYKFPTQTILLSKFLNSTAAFNWVDLKETSTKSLLNYGEFSSEETKFEIEKDLKKILTLTEQLIKE